MRAKLLLAAIAALSLSGQLSLSGGGLRRPQGGAPAARPAALAKPLVLPDITGFDQLTAANCNPDQSGATTSSAGCNPTASSPAAGTPFRVRVNRMI